MTSLGKMNIHLFYTIYTIQYMTIVVVVIHPFCCHW